MPFETIASSTTLTTDEDGQHVYIRPDSGSISRVTVTPPSGPVTQLDMQPNQLYTFGLLDEQTAVFISVLSGTVQVDTNIRGWEVQADSSVAPAPNGVDDTQMLVAEFAKSAQRINLKAGTYLVSSQITWQSNRVLVGHPDGTTIKAKNGTNLNWMFATSGATPNIGAEGVTFDANTSGQSSGNNGLFDFGIGTPTGTKWRNCVFTGTKSNNINIKGTTHLFERCTWTNVRGAITLWDGCSDVLFDRCTFKEYSVGVSTTAVLLQGTNGTNGCNLVRFLGCNWVNSALSNHFAIEAVSPGLDLWHEILVEGCVFDGYDSGGTGISGVFQHSSIIGNRWLRGANSNRSGIEVAGSYLSVIGNQFDSGVVNVGSGDSAGLFSSMREGFRCQSNTFKTVSSTFTAISHIQIKDQANFVIEGNASLIDPTGSATVQSSIYLGVFGVAAPIRNGVVKNNILRCSSTSSGNGIRLLTGIGANSSLGTNYGKNILIEGNKIVGFSNGILLPSTANDTDVHVLGNEILTSGTAKISGALFGDGCIVANTVSAAGDPYDGAISTKTGAYTATVLDRTIKASTASGFTLTLPPFPYKGQVLDIKRVTTEGSTLTIAANDSPIDGSLTSITDTATNRPNFRFRGERRSQTFTVTIATPGVVTATAHAYIDNQVVYLATSGALPTGLTAGTKYFVRNSAANTFELSTTSGGGSIATSGTQSGTHTVTTAEWIRQ